MQRRLYAKHFELQFPDRASAPQFYMITRYTDNVFFDTVLISSRDRNFRKNVTYIYLEEAIDIARAKIKTAEVPRILKAWKSMLERLLLIEANYREVYTTEVESKEFRYKQPSVFFINQRKRNLLMKKLRRQEFLNKWREVYAV